MKNLVFVGDRCNDHSPNSGYDQLCSLFPEAGWLSGRALGDGEMRWHRRPPDHADESDAIFHVIYGDCSGKALPALLRTRYPRSKIVSSLHRPVALLQSDPIAVAGLERTDVVVTVSQLQAVELQEYGLSARVRAIPHGVWTRVFRPNAETAPTEERSAVLMVGSFLRDWEGAKKVLESLSDAGVRTFVLGAGARENLKGNELPPGVDVMQRVSEPELAQMYQRSAAVFLPFLHATASNALLEAMAAGCPVICPRFPSLIDEYLDDDSDSFEVGQYDVAASRILHYTRSASDRNRKASALMARAESFDWARMKERFASIYLQLATA